MKRWAISWLLGLLILGCGRSWEAEVQRALARGDRRAVERLLYAHQEAEPRKVSYYRGRLYLKEGAFKNALEQFLGAEPPPRDLRDSLVHALHVLADTARKLRLEEVARGAYEAVDRIAPESLSVEGARLLARIYRQMEDLNRARRYYERYLALGGSLREIAGTYFPLLADLGQVDTLVALGDSLRTFEDADALWAYGNALYDLALQNLAEGDTAGAVRRLRRLLALGGPEILLDDAYLTLGEIELVRGDTTSAVRQFQLALTYALPRSLTARRARAYLSRLGETRFLQP